MAIQVKNDESESKNKEFIDSFEANGVFMTRDDSSDIWNEEVVSISSRDDIRELFKPYEVTQIDVNRCMKVYTAIDNLANRAGVDGRVVDDNGNIHLLVSPILLLECDEIEPRPIFITKETKKTFKDILELY